MTNLAVKTDVLIVGGGPAGLAAAVQASAAGLSVHVVDERVSLGGQIYKRMGPGFAVDDAARLGREYVAGGQLIERVVASDAEVLLNTAVIALDGTKATLCENEVRSFALQARRVILAPGAYDRPVPFEGWTLPGVLTAGGAQTLLKTQRVIPGDRIVFTGCGPVGVAFPAHLLGLGANLVLICDAGPAPKLRDAAAIAKASRGNGAMLRDAVRYGLATKRAGIPVRHQRMVIAAEGDGRVESAVHAAVDIDWRVIPGTEERVSCDAICVGYGFVPSTELMRLAGCGFEDDENLGGAVVKRDDWLRTTVDGISAVGDGAGVEGVDVAVDEGRLAALGVARELGAISDEEAARLARPLRTRISRKRTLREALERMHGIGRAVYEISTPDTVICRCESVTRREIEDAGAAARSVGVVKGLTRAGMGLCQGRNCQRTVASLVAACSGCGSDELEMPEPRLPVRPIAIGAVADPMIEDDGLFTPTQSER